MNPTPAPILARLAASLALFALPCAQAELITYDFSGHTSVGGSMHAYTGVFSYESTATASTVYRPGTGPLQQGFESTYAGAVRELSIRLDNGETVSTQPGNLAINNIQQAEPGSQLPAGLSAQAWTGGATGTINGFHVFNMYLAFLPLQPNYSWDGLDDYFGGNAEQMLQANPSALPSNIDPMLTGTALPLHLLDTFTAGVFLGTNHNLTNTVNDAGNFVLRAPVPEPSSWALLLGGLLVLPLLRRRVAR